jgi:NADH dehydrogenase [ubiquinone] 1 alpha subcomplex assembly factor 6
MISSAFQSFLPSDGSTIRLSPAFSSHAGASRRIHSFMTMTLMTTSRHRASSIKPALTAITARARSSSGTSASSSPDVSELRAAFRHCVEVVRLRDYEAYLCTLHLPKPFVPIAFAVRALNAESGSVVGSADSVDAARMRLMWWRRAIDGLTRLDDDDAEEEARAGGQHPVLVALRAALGNAPSARAKTWMKRMIDARITDASASGPPGSVMELERYASDAHGSALTLALDACGIRNADADHAASHLGKAIGLSALLRGTTAHAKQRRCYFPSDACARRGVSTESVYRLEPSEGARDVAHEVATVAKAHLDSARAMAERIPSDAKPFFLQAVPVGRYLDALEAKDFDAFDEAVARGGPPLFTQAAVAWSAFRGTY